MIGNLAQELSTIVEQAHSLHEILDRIVPVIARRMAVDACSVFLLEATDRRLHLAATCGLDRAALESTSLAVREGLVGEVVAQMRPMAVEQAAAHPAYRDIPGSGEEQLQSFLGVPMAIRGRPLGAIVVHTAHRHRYTEPEIHELEAASAQLVGIVANARLIEALDRGEAAERALGVPPSREPAAEAARERRELTGCPASPGIAIGEVVLRGCHVMDLDRGGVPFQGEAIERRRVADALEKTRNDILRIQRSAALEADEEHALIFSSHLLLLNDPVLLRSIDQAVGAGATAQVAIDRTLQDLARKLEAVPDPYIQERVEDIHDLRCRVLGYVLAEDQPERIGGRIVVAARLPPSLVVEIKVEGARGLITEIGGTTAHGVLLARSMRIPVVTGVTGAAALLRPGDQLVIDGAAGTVLVNPAPGVVAEFAATAERLERQRTEHARFRDLPAVTADGVRVRLEANVSIAADLAAARESGAEGVGLYRTEFPFILREEFPTREEQVRIYARAYEAFPRGPITFRILDLGGDKFVPGGPVATARSPFHGYRSIRVLFDHPQVLRDQVQAFALAAAGRPLRVLIPMVSSLEELRRVKALIGEALAGLGDEAAGPLALGAMIETPAAVELAGDIARECDFLSIGTNDLIQYSLVADREDPRMTSASDAYHPAILRMIRRVVCASHAAGRPVCVCGEMAADPRLAVLLIALGVDALSVIPAVLPELKQALAGAAARPLAEALDAVLSCPDAAGLRAALRAAAPPARDLA